MIEQRTASKTIISIDPDYSICDIDIDFDLNNGKGAWVVVLSKHGHRPLLADGKKPKGGEDGS